MNKVTKLVISLAVPQIVGLSSAVLSPIDSDGWYSNIVKPALNPPGWVFGPVWTLLYILMGVSLYIVWNQVSDTKARKWGIFFWSVQMGLNGLWSILFFTMQRPDLALVDIALLWVSIVVTIKIFYRVSRASAWLLVPYLLWVSFASYLSYSIWVLN